MTADRHLLKVGELCRQLTHHGRRLGRRIARAVSEPFRDRLPGRPEVIDLCDYQALLADELEARYARLVAWRDRWLHEVELVRELRRRRELAERELRERLMQISDALKGSYPSGPIKRFLGQFWPLPSSVDGLLQLAELFATALVNPRLDLPPPREGVEVDLEVVAASLDAPARRLGAVLDELADAEAAERHSRALRSEAMDRLKSFAAKVVAYYQALSDLAGDERLTRRLAKIARRGQFSGSSR